MAVTRQVFTKVDRFDRAQLLSTTPSGEFGWTLKDTSSAGSPTFVCTSGEGMVLTIASTDESEIVTMYQNNVLPYLATKIRRVWFIVKVAGVTSLSVLTFGLASAQNDVPDDGTHNIWFRMEGSVSTSNLLTETDDATTNDDDNATAATLAAVLKKCEIDFQNGMSDIRFNVDGARVHPANLMGLAALASTDKLQLIVQIQKPSGAGVAAITIREIGIEYAAADGA